MRQIFLVYNPRSSHHDAIQREVLARVRNLSGWMVAKYEIKPTSFTDNVQKLQMLFTNEALVIVAGGDGTATIAANAILESGKDVTFAVLGYGNFNDLATTLNTNNVRCVDASTHDEQRRRLEVQNLNSLDWILQAYADGQFSKLYPLKIAIDDEFWRYAPCYASVGLLAEATTILEDDATRQQLNSGKKSKFFSLRMAIKWYLHNHRRKFLPEVTLNDVTLNQKTTDYLAVNSQTLAGIMKGGNWWQDAAEFGSTTQALGGFWQMVKFGLCSVRKGVPLEVTQHDVLEFAAPSNVWIQSEGEFAHLEQVSKIEIQKTETYLKVITRNYED